MRKTAFIATLLILLSGIAFAQDAYDHTVAVAVMRGNASMIGQITASAGKNDFPGTARNLMLMAQGMNKLLAMVPPKGSLEDWQKTLSAFVNTAYRGIGACAAQDSALLATAVTDLKAYMKSGHSEFRF